MTEHEAWGTRGIRNDDKPLPDFPATITCLFALPHPVDISNDSVFEIPASSASIGTAEGGQRWYQLHFQTSLGQNLPVPAARNIDDFRAMAQRRGVVDVTFDEPEKWEYDKAPHWRTIVAVETDVPDEATWTGSASPEGGTLPAPLACMQVLIDFHRVYKTHTIHALPDLTVTTLWNAFPVLLARSAEPPTFYSWWSSPDGDPGVDYYEVEGHTQEHYEKLISAFARHESGDPLLSYYERLVQGETELVSAGRPHEAVYQVATASEALISNVALMMMWERHERGVGGVEDAARFHNKALSKRCKNMQHLLGAGWAELDGRLWGAWNSDVWAVRNRVVHADYRASAAEASLAVAAVAQLKRDLNTALVERFTEYPRTALLMLSGGDLEDLGTPFRSRVDAYLQRAYEEAAGDIPQRLWVAAFMKWRERVFEQAEALSKRT